MHYVKAIMDDIGHMQKLVEKEVIEGTILHRSDDEVATNIRSYVLAKEDGVLAGYGALHIHNPALAEIRSLIVEQSFRSKGVGKGIVLSALKEAEALGLREVLVLTYIPEFFLKLGFKQISKEAIPDHKIWADCIKCIHFPVCNESALIYKIK